MSDRETQLYVDLLRRRADVYSPDRERNPYYGDDDIDLLLGRLRQRDAEIKQLRKEVWDCIAQSTIEARRVAINDCLALARRLSLPTTVRNAIRALAGNG